MDMVTLAMAKAYTDSKVGGGSGGGTSFVSHVELETVIPLDSDNPQDKEIPLSNADIEKLETLGAGPALFTLKFGNASGDGSDGQMLIVAAGITQAMFAPGFTQIARVIEFLQMQVIFGCVNGTWTLRLEYLA